MDATHAHGARTRGDRRQELSALRSPAARRVRLETDFETPNVTSRPRDCVLFEFLDGGARPEDSRERARAVTARGGVAILAGEPPDPNEESLSLATTPRDAWRDAVQRALDAAPGATLLLAGDEAIACRAAFVDRAGTVCLWPTALAGDAGEDERALAHAVAAQARVSSRDSLWDGDYVVVPGVPDHAAAELVVAAFARVAEDLPSLDLVFLGDAPHALGGLAADYDVPWRVHWAGPSPLRAECTWLAGAAAIVVTDREAADASLALRALASASPVFVAGRGDRARHLRDWFSSMGSPQDGVAAEGLASGLATVFGKSEQPARALGRSRAEMPKYAPTRVLDRLIGTSPAAIPARPDRREPLAA